jgi:hypothetical protein
MDDQLYDIGAGVNRGHPRTLHQTRRTEGCVTHTELQATVERDVRLLIGDLTMQLVIARAQLAAAQQEPVEAPKHNGSGDIQGELRL